MLNHHLKFWKWIQARHILAITSFFGFINVYCLRVNLSVALVAMINNTYSGGAKNISESCHIAQHHNSNNTTSGHTEKRHEGEFNWDGVTKNYILSSFFYGYIISQIIGGLLAERYGGKLVFGLGILSTSLLTLITPPVARLGWGPLIALRVLEGIGEGVTYPGMHSMWSRWAPPLEKSKLASFTYAGSHLGTVIAMPISGLLSAYGFAGGWPSVFYVFGILGIIWFVFWMVLVADTPAKHPRISAEEKEYIESSIGKTQTCLSKDPVPWRDIWKSLPVWAMIIAHFGNNWGFYTLLTNLPTYMNDILGFKISENGFLSSLPYLCCWLISVVSGLIVDYARKRGISTTILRRICTTLGLLGPAFALIGVSFAKCNYVGAVVAFCIGTGLEGFVFSGFLINHLDIAPKFAGTLFGITNTAGTISGIFAPMVVGYMTETSNSQHQWQKIFWISSSIYAGATLFYVIFSSGEQQPWAERSLANQGDRSPKVETIEKNNITDVNSKSRISKEESSNPNSPQDNVIYKF